MSKDKKRKYIYHFHVTAKDARGQEHIYDGILTLSKEVKTMANYSYVKGLISFKNPNFRRDTIIITSLSLLSKNKI